MADFDFCAELSVLILILLPASFSELLTLDRIGVKNWLFMVRTFEKSFTGEYGLYFVISLVMAFDLLDNTVSACVLYYYVELRIWEILGETD